MPHEPVEFLRQCPLWASLPEEGLNAVEAAMQPMTYAPGEVIVRQGEPGSRLHLITSGQAEARILTPGGSVVTVAAFHAGDCFGEMSLLSGDPVSADVVATEDSETLALDRGAFNALVAANPDLLRDFVRMVSRRLSTTDVAVGAAREKEQDLTRFLLEEKSEQYGDLIGEPRAIKGLQKQIEEESKLTTPLLIQGEKGTGKELVARLAHFRGAQKEAPLLSTDCGQIGENQWGDQLFGDYHRKDGPHPRAMCYMDLAEGGALLLKNIEALPPAIQERLVRFLHFQSEPSGVRRNVRIIATCRANLSDEAAVGSISPDLAAMFLGHVIVVPSLRERKRDIPDLANHFMRKHARRLNKQIESLDDQAVIKLVSYDYLIANVQELEEAIERAVIINDDGTIGAEEIFLGPPPDMRPHGLNLLALPKPVVQLALRLFPTGIRALTAAFFAFILYQCFFAPATRDGNIGTLLVWSVWWPALVISFLFAGRAWCAVCPMAFAGGALQRFSNLKLRIPSWLKDNDVYIAMAGLFAIILVEELTGMRHEPRITGVLLLCILSGAVTVSLLFPRRTWCRHICPLGGLAGLCSTSAMVELRPTLDICTAKCKGHSCYKGDDAIPGCPMFNHVMFVDSNQNCVLCMNCVRSCPNGSPQLNIRMPARELWTSLSSRPEVGRFVAVLLGVVVGQTFLQYLERQPHTTMSGILHEHHFLFVSGVLILSAGIPLLYQWLLTRRFSKSSDPATSVQFWKKVAAWIPLATTGYACYQLAFIPGLEKLQATIGYEALQGGGVASLSFSLLSLTQAVILLAGCAVTTGAHWKLWQLETGGKRKNWSRDLTINLVGVLAYWVMLQILMLRPEWLLG